MELIKTNVKYCVTHNNQSISLSGEVTVAESVIVTFSGITKKLDGFPIGSFTYDDSTKLVKVIDCEIEFIDLSHDIV